MIKLNQTSQESANKVIQLVTFTVGDIILGIDISFVQEINRQIDITNVPGTSPMIHGVVNLRGDVVTVIDPHRIFGIESNVLPEDQRNLILQFEGERVGVLVDKVSDILTVHESDLSRRPSNVQSIDAQFIQSVYLREDQIVVVLNATALINAIDSNSEKNSAA